MWTTWQRRSALLSSHTANFVILAVAILLIWHPSFLVLPPQEHNEPFVFLAGACLLAQCLSTTWLLLAVSVTFKKDDDDEKELYAPLLLRAATVSLAGTGLILMMCTAGLNSAFPRVAALMASSGALVFLAACATLMITYWPQQLDCDEDVVGVGVRGGVSIEERRVLTTVPSTEESTTGGGGGDGYLLLTDEDTIEQQPLIGTASSSSDEPTSRLRGTRRLLQLAKPQVGYLYAGCAVLLLRLPFSLSIPHFVSSTLSAVHANDFERATTQIVCLIIAGSIDAALDFWCVFLFGYANLRIVRGVRLDLFRQLIRQEVAFFDQTTSGELGSRLQSDCSEMAGDLTWFFRFSIESIVRITGITAYMLLRSPLLGLCALSIAPVVAVVNKLYGNWLRTNATMVQDALAEANSVAQEALANIRTVISFAAESTESGRYKEKIQRHYQLNVKQLYMTGVYYMAVSTFMINTIVQALLLFIGARMVQNHTLTAEVLLAFMLYQGQLQNETLNLFQSYSSLIKSSGAGDKVFALLDRKPPPPSINSSVVRAQEEGEDIVDDSSLHQKRRQYNVELKHVSFAYPSRPDDPVLDRIDLEIPKGKTVALVGLSGCGKSTIISLLQRFYDPNMGKVVIDGTDLRQMDLLAHRRHIGVVTQDPVLFAGTILQNITYGCPRATREEAIEAARLANADEFIRFFPQEYETTVGERGVQLSGGQKQRIAIARALVKNPSLLLLDEATSALDGESEQIVQTALDRLLKANRDMTTVIVAHRLRTVQNADCIAVIHDGRVAEMGSHDELYANRKGLYRKMVEHAGPSGILPDTTTDVL